MPVLGSAMVLHGGGRGAANVQGRLEVSFVCELRLGMSLCLMQQQKGIWGAVKDLRGAWSCLSCPCTQGGPSAGDRQEAMRGKKKEIFSFIL